MRMPRRRFLIALVLAVVLGLSIRLCRKYDVYYHVKGWLHGDAYYLGMPTCYWADCLNTDDRTPVWLKSVYEFIGIKSFRRAQEIADVHFFCQNPDAAGVLLQLAGDGGNSPQVRAKAIRSLRGSHKQQADDLAHICAGVFLNEKENAELRRETGYALVELAAERKVEDVDFAPLLQCADPETKAFAAAIMWARGERLEVVGPLLMELIEKKPGTNPGNTAHAVLACHSGTDTVPFLLQANHNPDKDVRWVTTVAIVNWLSKGPNLARDQEPLKSALARLTVLAASDPDAEVRESAKRALEHVKRK